MQHAPTRHVPYWPQLAHYVKFEREGGRCQHCGAKHGEFDIDHGIYKSVLTCAHADHDETNNHPDNLLALCAPCHLDYDREDNARRRKINDLTRHGQTAMPFENEEE